MTDAATPTCATDELAHRPPRLAIIGLGYVGLPLAVEFGRRFPTIGFDINEARIAELERAEDRTLEVDSSELRAATHLRFSARRDALASANTFIVTVPTPIDEYKRPDLTPLVRASETVGAMLKAGDIVVYESTVYPGCTEEVCVPILERASGLVFNRDFFAGYSPERINPGDKQHRLPDIRKVTSGSTAPTAAYVDALYRTIITAGTHRAPSLQVAEAAKVIENTQRDLNIALMNELALIFARLGIDTEDVLKAAGTKWNFLPFRPGLVGGHCIGVDPYYLTHKAQAVGYHPEVILAGRRINDSMGRHIAAEVVRQMSLKGQVIRNSRVLVLGMTFKENCPDLRNSRVIDIVAELQSFGARVEVHEPWTTAEELAHEYGVTAVTVPEEGAYDALVLAVAHDRFRALGHDGLARFARPNHVFYDVKSVFARDLTDGRL